MDREPLSQTPTRIVETRSTVGDLTVHNWTEWPEDGGASVPIIPPSSQ